MAQNQQVVSGASPRRRSRGLRTLLPVFAVLLPQAAVAANLDGSWATNLDACKDIFVKKGNAVSLARDADLYGSGFVISGNMVRGKIATCKITSMKEAGKTIHVRSTCATDISVSNNQFDLKILDKDKLIRAVPGVPEMDTPYYRCPDSK